MRLDPFVLLLGLMAPLCTSCVHHYRAPNSQESHATVLLRLEYRDAPSGRLEESVTVNDASLALPRANPRQAATITRLVRVRPGESVWRVAASFAREKLRRAPDLGARESFPCATTAPSGGTSTVRAGSVCTGASRGTEQDPLQAPVLEAECTAELRVHTSAGDALRVTYVFEGDHRCHVECTREPRDEAGEEAICQ